MSPVELNVARPCIVEGINVLENVILVLVKNLLEMFLFYNPMKMIKIPFPLVVNPVKND
jgi:hypothetical protein